MPHVKGSHRADQGVETACSAWFSPPNNQFTLKPLQFKHKRQRRGETGSSPFALIWALLLAVLVWPFPSSSGQWYDEPTVTARLGFDDNVRFTAKKEESSFSQKLSAKTGLGYRTEVTDIKLGVRADVQRYSEESDLDTDDQYLDLNAKHRTGHNLFGLNGRFIRDTSRTSELETTGRVQRSKRRLSSFLNPTWTRTLDERNSVRLDYTHNKVIYQDSNQTGLLDYRSHAARGALFHDLDELTQLSATFTYTHYRVPKSNSEADDYGFQVGVTRALSETVQGSLVAGGRETTSKVRDDARNTIRDTNYGLLLSASLEKRLERTIVRGGVLRELRPTGSGRLIDSRSASIDVRHRLSERLTFFLDTSVFRNETNNDSFNQVDDEQRTYFSTEPKLRWRFTRWWDVVGSYRYRYQKLDGSGTSADSNAVFLYVTYNWPRDSVAKWSEL